MPGSSARSNGPPRFRSRPKYTSFTLKQSGWKLVGPGKLRIQGRCYRFHPSREIAGQIKALTISRDAGGRHFASFSCKEVPRPGPPSIPGLPVSESISTGRWPFRLGKEFDDLAFEDLNLKGMHRIRGRKAGDPGFRAFLAKQQWLAEKYGPPYG